MFEKLNEYLIKKRDFQVKVKDEIVPNHGTKLYGGSRCIPPPILNLGTSGQLHSSSACPPPPKKENIKYEAGGGKESVQTSSYSCQDSKTRPSSPYPSHYLNYAVPAPTVFHVNRNPESGLL